jgi:uncharacterized membrane protein
VDIDLLPWARRLIPAAIAIAVLVWAARDLPGYKLRGDREAQNVLILSTAVLMGIRWFNVDAFEGVHLHFIWACIAALMFGARFALCAMALVSLVAWAMHSAWHGPFSDFLATSAIPVGVVSMVAWAVARWLPANIFIYVLCTAFASGALSIASSNLFKAAMNAWFFMDEPSWPYLIATPPMMFGEGFFCGGAMVLIVVYRPQWCASFDDDRYLAPPTDDKK